MAHRLLLADDSVTIQRVIELTFAEEGVDVVSVGDGLAAIDRLRTERFDIVLADVGMPGKDGFEVASYVRSRPELAGVAVVLLTGAFDALDESRVGEVGAAAVLVKPFEPQMVIAKVRDLLSGRHDAGSAAAAAANPPAARAGHAPAQSTDDYFDRLDKAFAALNTTLEPRDAIRQVASSSVAPEEPEGPRAPEGPLVRSAGKSPEATRMSTTPGLADTFATLLAVEQGELPASALLPPPRAGDDELVDRIARRVVEQLGDRAVRELAADIVSRTAERLVKEEIERIKTGG